MSREFLQAISKNEVEIVKEMISSDSNLLQLRNQTGESPILTAVYHGATASRDFLLGQGIQLDLFEAAAVGELQRVRELIDEDRNRVNEYGNDGFTPLGLAAFFGHKEVVEELLAKGADPNIASNNSMRVAPLHSGIASRQVEIVELLLKHGAEVNVAQQAGWTPLHEAAFHGDERMIKLLLERGADKAMKKEDGETPLDVAIRHEQGHVWDFLR